MLLLAGYRATTTRTGFAAKTAKKNTQAATAAGNRAKTEDVGAIKAQRGRDTSSIFTSPINLK